MKKLSILFCSLMAVILMSSCSTEINTVAHSRTVNANFRDAKVMPVHMGVKVDYDKRVQYISEVINLKNVGGKEGALEVAEFDCLYKNNIDVLVDPIYKITKYDNKNVIIMLQAHPGYYVEAPACTMKNNYAAPVNMRCKGMYKRFGKKSSRKCHAMPCPTQGMPMQFHPQGMMQCPKDQGNCHHGKCSEQQDKCQNQCPGKDQCKNKSQCQEKCNKDGGECSQK